MTTTVHGIRTSEVPTSVRPPVSTYAGLPVVIGSAPVVLGVRANVNKPVLCSSAAEYASQLGGGAVADYTLAEFARVYFGLYGVSPAVFINVLDPDDEDHLDPVARAALAWTDGQTSQTIEVFAIDDETVVLDDGDTPPVAYTLTTDYTLAYDSDGYLVITRVAAGAMGTGALPLAHLTYSKLDPTGVTVADVIGAAGTISSTGIYALEDVYPRLQLAPGMVLAPGYSQEPTVMAAMVARAASINGAFKAQVVCDLDPDEYEIADYSEAGAWKSDNSFTSKNLVCCWPKVTMGTEVHYLSSHYAGLANQVDAAANGVPYVSPSNQALMIDGTCLEDESEVFLSLAQGNVLNGQGIVTAINFAGWRLWGNRTAGYPASTDPKDAFIPIRRMTLWLQNILTLNYFSKVDAAMNRRLIESIVDSVNIYLNGLKGAGAIIDGECVFAEADNPTTSLLDGDMTFRIYWTPPPPAESIQFVIEYDATALAALFG